MGPNIRDHRKKSWPAIPDELESVVLHALEKDPGERPANAAEFRNELIALTENWAWASRVNLIA